MWILLNNLNKVPVSCRNTHVQWLNYSNKNQPQFHIYMTWFVLPQDTPWRNDFVVCIDSNWNILHVSFKTINPEAKVNRGLRSFCAPRSWQLKAPLHIELRWSQVSSDSLVEGENTLSGEIVFTVCRKLITSNKLISRYCFRINCIFTEVTGSDGSSSSDKGGHRKWSIELCGLSVPLLYIRMHLIILKEII